MTAFIDPDYPFAGRWLIQNSPANRVPSHGTTLFATSHAIDFVPVANTGRTAPITARLLIANLPAITDDLQRGAIVSLTPDRLRIRDLPLG